jgi:SAM-dependent methyltransferase
MRYAALAGVLPGFLRRYVLHFEGAVAEAVGRFAEATPPGARVLDAGAGEGRYAHRFTHTLYCGVDLAVGDDAWDYTGLDCIADLTSLPFRDGTFTACLNIVTLEHVREPACVLAEIARVMSPDARFLIVVPHEWEVHQAPHDYFRYTKHGIEYLLERSGFSEIHVEPVGGYFRLVARRLLNGLQFFAGGIRWLGFLPAALFLVPPALVLPVFDFLDRDRNFTLGYICTATKSK